MIEDMSVSYMVNERLIERMTLSAFALRAMSDEIAPVRKPAFYKGQTSLPGYFWMSRMDELVMYESRLEMVVLLQLDFNPLIISVVSQPCVIHYSYDSRRYRHTPDFFVRYKNDVGELINVKPRKYVEKERNLRSFAACESASVEMGFANSIRSETEPTFLSNLWWLSGYRRIPPQAETYGVFLIECAAAQMTIGEIHNNSELPALMRPVLFYMIWKNILSIDLYTKMTENTVVSLAGVAQNGL